MTITESLPACAKAVGKTISFTEMLPICDGPGLPSRLLAVVSILRGFRNLLPSDCRSAIGGRGRAFNRNEEFLL